MEEVRVPKGGFDLGLVSRTPLLPDLARYGLGVLLAAFPGCWMAQHPLHRDVADHIAFCA